MEKVPATELKNRIKGFRNQMNQSHPGLGNSSCF